jgi:hypothetical protein
MWLGGGCGGGLRLGRKRRLWMEFVHVKNGSQLDSAGLFLASQYRKQALVIPFPWSFSVQLVRHFLILSTVLSFLSGHVFCAKPLIPSRLIDR